MHKEIQKVHTPVFVLHGTLAGVQTLNASKAKSTGCNEGLFDQQQQKEEKWLISQSDTTSICPLTTRPLCTRRRVVQGASVERENKQKPKRSPGMGKT